MNAKATQLTHLRVLLVALALVALLPQASIAQGKSASKSANNPSGQRAGEEYSGNIFYFGGPRGSVSTTFTIRLNSLSPDSEVDQIINALREGGQDQLIRTIGKNKRGTIQINQNLGRDINAAWVTEDEEGRKLTILAERWMGFGEVRRGGRSVDYPFTYVELYVEADGKGEGSLFPAARVRLRKGRTIEVENFGIYPARLTNVRQRGR